MTSQCCQPYM
nr:unnamed protein product [Callosobruchus chinensis]CAH7718910.1 unnamed protein product [Callosobruchus chinensis]